MWSSNCHLGAISLQRNSLVILLFLVAILSPAVEAQSSPPSMNNDSNQYWGNQYSFNPSVAILIIVLISAFFFLGFLSVYIRNCGGNGDGTGTSIRGHLAAMARSRRQRGLDAAVLETFPIMVYSEVKEHKIGKGALECAVCLCEFEDDENIRLLPKCDHVFHTDCIDEWLSSHVTCPVCRCNLTPDTNQPSEQTEEGLESGNLTQAVEETQNPPSTHPDSAVIIDVDEHDDERRRRQEAVELDRIGSQRRALRAKSVRQQPEFPRSHSTGHSLAAPPVTVKPDGSVDRYTLRLPDHIRREIISSGQLERAKSVHSFPSHGEASSRQGYSGGGEGSNRMGRSVRFARTDRWPSFITRTISTRAPAWITNRRGDTEGSVKKPDGEGSNKGKQGSTIGAFDCLGVASGSKVESAREDEDETIAIARRV